MSQQTTGRSWRFPRPLIEDNIGFLLLLWGGFVAVVTGIALGIAWFGDLTQSVLDPASQVALWGLAVIVGMLVYSYLPLYIANGRTRKSAAIEGGIFLLVIGAVAAALMTVSYLIEEVLYRIGGWPTDLENEHLFTSHLQSHLVFSEYALLFLVWVFGGAVVGAGFYRSDNWGWLFLIVGIFFGNTVMTGMGLSGGPFGFLTDLLDIDTPSFIWGLVLGAVILLISAAVGWLMVRDVPVRPKSG